MQTTVHDMFLRRKWIAAIYDKKEKRVSPLVSCSRTDFNTHTKKIETKGEGWNLITCYVVRQASCSSLSEQVSYRTDACIADSLRQNSLFFERSNPFTLCRCLLSRRVPSDSPTHSFIHSGKSQEMSLIFMSETYDLSVGTLS